MRKIKQLPDAHIAHILCCCLATAALAMLVFSSRALALQQVKIGVLATRGPEQCMKTWGPTAEYLTSKIPGASFIIVPLSHDQIKSSVQKADIDFILTNSSFYIELEEQLGVNRITTLKESRLGKAYSKYGSVIFSRADRNDVHTLKDLKGKSFMAVSEGSLGGWQMAWRELKEKGIDPYKDFKSLVFAETHDNVVYAVRDGIVDAGTVRTNTLEEMEAEGKIVISDFFVFPRLFDPQVTSPYLCTTREYPEWPMAKIKETSDELAEKVAIALLQMAPDSPAAVAAGCAGWTIPLNYQPVMDLMMTLHLGPYKNLGKIHLKDIIRTYSLWLLVAFIFFCSHIAFTFLILKLNRRIKISHASLTKEIEMHKKLDKELEQAKQLAEAATLAKSRFLANMSHEIRTPMNGIIAATDLALAEKLKPEVEHYLHIVQNSSYSLLGIINDILDFSKIEAGQFELKERVFRLDEMFDRVMDVFVNQTAAKDIELLVDIDSNTPRVLHGDSLRLQQILTNLIGNAVKFTGPGGIIRASVMEMAAPELQTDKTMLRFAVKDTGTGIAAEYLPLLFEPFTQEDSSSTRKYEGTGLGLSICKRFVTMMHGHIWVDTEPNKGSTFLFTVVLGKTNEPSGQRFVFPEEICNLRVLVVDDCLDSREIMEKMLRSFGCLVEKVSSGPEAILHLKTAVSQNTEYNLLIVDWKMPELDGIETSRRVREDLQLTLPIIMMTAFAREVHKSTAEQVGINGFLTKPIFQSTLFDAIMDAFGKADIRKEGGKTSFTTKASLYKKQLKGCRILVAEDNLTNQEVAIAILKGAGIIVTVANNGEEAVAKVANEQFDAVLMDVQMPLMNGFQATKEIRQLPGGKTLPIIAMTAHALKGDEEKCLEAGMDGYVSKPINQDRLFYTLWRRLKRGMRDQHDNTAASHHNPDHEGQEKSTETAEQRPSPTFDSQHFSVPGIDVNGVLQATGLDLQTFRNILTGFAKDNKNAATTMQDALEKGDFDTLQHLAHSLKGSAGNIGAEELRQTASQLENYCIKRRDLTEVAPEVQKVQESLTSLLNHLSDITSSNLRVAEDKIAIENNQLPHLLENLAEAINRADPGRIEELTAHVVTGMTGLQMIDQNLLIDLHNETQRYDYDQALKTLESLQQAFMNKK